MPEYTPIDIDTLTVTCTLCGIVVADRAESMDKHDQACPGREVEA